MPLYTYKPVLYITHIYTYYTYFTLWIDMETAIIICTIIYITYYYLQVHNDDAWGQVFSISQVTI
jgi:hypothetical protein